MENLDEVIFYRLESAIKTYRQLAQKNITLSGLDMTVDQWLIMKVVLENGELKQNEIAEKVFKDAASVTRIIDLLINTVIVNRPTNVKMIDITPRSCKGVAIKKISIMLAAPINFKILADCLEEIFFDILIKKIP